MIDNNYTVAANKKELFSIFQQLNEPRKKDLLHFARFLLEDQTEKDNKTDAEKTLEKEQNERKARAEYVKKAYGYKVLGVRHKVPVIYPRTKGSRRVVEHETIPFGRAKTQ